MSEHRRIIAIGDGCVHALEAIVEQIDLQPSDVIVSLGDFMDQGRDTRDVIDLLIQLTAQNQLVAVRGNHEEMFLEALRSQSAFDAWFNAGGYATLNSYRYGGSMDLIPDDHIDFVRSTVDYYESEQHIFTHAGYDADLPMNQQPEYYLRWMLLEPPFPAPHVSGKKVFVGHTEQDTGNVLDLGYLQCIDTACWRYGWLTACDAASGQTWQVSRWGIERSEFEGATSNSGR